jgi:hypothetical protein
MSILYVTALTTFIDYLQNELLGLQWPVDDVVGRPVAGVAGWSMWLSRLTDVLFRVEYYGPPWRSETCKKISFIYHTHTSRFYGRFS